MWGRHCWIRNDGDLRERGIPLNWTSAEESSWAPGGYLVGMLRGGVVPRMDAEGGDRPEAGGRHQYGCRGGDRRAGGADPCVDTLENRIKGVGLLE